MCSLSNQFGRKSRSVVHLAKSFENGRAVNCDSAIGFFDVDKVAGQTFDVAVEDDAHELAITINHGRTGVAADDVQRRDKIEWRGKIDSVAPLSETRHEIKRRFVVERGRTVV